MVNREVIEQWVEALESGEYPQTIRALHRVENGPDGEPVGFCCLGVLTHLAAKKGIVDVLRVDEGGEVIYECDVDFTSTRLPHSVKEWAGLDSARPSVGYELTDAVHKATLAELNDLYGLTFPEIAQIIRDNFLND